MTLSTSISGRLQNDGHRRKAGVLVADGSSRRWQALHLKASHQKSCDPVIVQNSVLVPPHLVFLIAIHKAACPNMHNVVNIQMTAAESSLIYGLIVVQLSKINLLLCPLAHEEAQVQIKYSSAILPFCAFRNYIRCLFCFKPVICHIGNLEYFNIQTVFKTLFLYILQVLLQIESVCSCS